MSRFQQCINPACNATYALEDVRVACAKCSSLLDVRYDWSRLPVPKSLSFFEHRWSTKGTETEGKIDFSGVWRFRELLPFYRREEDIVTIGEGRTVLQQADLLGRQLGMKSRNLLLQYEGLNPSGSFKDNGMTAAFTACPHGGCASRRVRLHRQHQRQPRIVRIAGPKCRASCSSAPGRSPWASSRRRWTTAR